MRRFDSDPVHHLLLFWKRRFPSPRLNERRLLLEALEDRTAPAIFAPTTFADGTGPGTLRNAIAQANSNGQDNTIDLASGTYMLSPADGGELALTGANHSLTIQGTGQSIVNAEGGSRVFEVIGPVQATFIGLTITGGLAKDGGSVGGSNALGGGLLNNGGTVKLDAVSVTANIAQAGAGEAALGGGIYSKGSLTIVNSTISNNQVQGGDGAAGADGGSQQVGGTGQAGGDAQGAGIYVAGGSLSITGSVITGNTAVAGKGGKGGKGGHGAPVANTGATGTVGTPGPAEPIGSGGPPLPTVTAGPPPVTAGPTAGPPAVTDGGFTNGGGGNTAGGGGDSGSQRAPARGADGGVGGVGGRGQGGGLYVAAGQINISGVTISSNHVQGGIGGDGGDPGSGSPDGTPGNGGAGGLSQGGGLFIAGGNITLNGYLFSDNLTYDGPGGNSGVGGTGTPVKGYTQTGQGDRIYLADGAKLDAPPGVTSFDTVGTFDPTTATWYLRNENSAGGEDIAPFQYGAPGWTPITGDWNGDGVTTIGVVDPTSATWYLRNENSAGGADVTAPFAYGAPGWVPVVGNWTGGHSDGIGMFDSSTGTWYLRNEDSAGTPDIAPFQYGAPGWIPVVGDWNGSGVTTIGVVDPATMTWYLRSSNSAGAPTITPFQFGEPGWIPVVGDWSNNGTTTIGVIDPTTGTWYLRNENSAGGADGGVFAYGGAQWSYVAGQWQRTSNVSFGMPELAAGGPLTSEPDAVALTNTQLQQTVSAALLRLENAGIKPALLSKLEATTYEVGLLPQPLLGYTYAQQDTVVIDSTADGYGWYVDPSPLSDAAFTPDSNGELTAVPGSAAAGHMDLLTVVLHEMGHIAGYRDVSTAGHPGDLMDLTLAPGVRRTEALDTIFVGG